MESALLMEASELKTPEEMEQRNTAETVETVTLMSEEDAFILLETVHLWRI